LQSVIDNHRDIDDRLRRSDHITKDVLDSMVNEMFWEADHPNASALLRKSNMIVCRSRQKLSTRYQADDLSRTTSSLSYRLPPAHSPPTQPLPPIPQGQISELVSIPEQHSAPSVEKWRSQVKVSRNEDGDSEQESPIIPKQRMETLWPAGR
jgi:hypothetical protein